MSIVIGEYVEFLDRELKNKGFFSVSIDRHYLKATLTIWATFVCGDVGFVHIDRRYTIYKAKSEIVRELSCTMGEYFKWKKIREKANGGDTREESQTESSQNT